MKRDQEKTLYHSLASTYPHAPILINMYSFHNDRERKEETEAESMMEGESERVWVWVSHFCLSINLGHPKLDLASS